MNRLLKISLTFVYIAVMASLIAVPFGTVHAAAGGWIQEEGSWYYIQKDGSKAVGWLYEGKKWYFMDNSGVMQTGWITLDGITYYLKDSGRMVTGWQLIDDSWYYFKSSGAMASGWIRSSSKWYYLNPDGRMATGLVNDGGLVYLMNSDGIMMTGFQEYEGRRYKFKASGAAEHDKWIKDGNNWFYAGSDGAFVTDTSVVIDDVEYDFDIEGRWISPLQHKMESTQTAGMTDQIVLVVGHNLTFWDKDSKGLWEKKLDVYCGYGKNGFCEADTRVAGNKTTPIGSFPLTLAFGTGSGSGFPMDYRKITKYSYWSSEKDETYNTWVESKKTMKGEHLKDYYQYKYAMAIGFNMDPAVIGRGSAIFLHCKSNNTWNTAGCVSVKESDMLFLMKNVGNGAYIIIVPDEEYLAQAQF